VEFFAEGADRYDLATVSESGNLYGIQVVTTGAATTSYIKVRVFEGDAQLHW
jgi:hypothetical protein